MTLGNNPVLNLSYVLRLNANPALQSGHTGMILCQKGQESVCITVSSAQPYPTANPETHIELFKVKAPELAQKNDVLDHPPNLGSSLTVPSPW